MKKEILVVALLPLFVLSACGSTVRYQGDLLQRHIDQLPQLPQPYRVIKIRYRTWSTLGNWGPVARYGRVECHELLEPHAMLCVDVGDLESYRFMSFPVFGTKPWQMKFRYWYTDLSGKGRNRHFYIARYYPPHQNPYPSWGYGGYSLSRHYEPEGEVEIKK